MGLDVYVGTLTRYYSGNWETIIQQASHENGMPVTIVRPNDQPDAVTDEEEIESVVLAWRDALSTQLEPHVGAPLKWIEGMTPPYFTDKPAWDGFSALALWAAHEEHRGVPLPAVAPDDWNRDTAVQRSQADGFKSRYGQLLHGPELWLPGEFDFTVRASDANQSPVIIGAIGTLLAQLRDLNARTWKMDPATTHQCRLQGAEPGGPLELSAKFAFAVFLELAESAVQHQLPMKLDY